MSFPDTSWMDEASCRSSDDPEAFFLSNYGASPEDKQRIKAAKLQCEQGCPVREKCMAYSLTTGEHWGYWGGIPQGKRRKRLKVVKQAA